MTVFYKVGSEPIAYERFESPIQRLDLIRLEQELEIFFLCADVVRPAVYKLILTAVFYMSYFRYHFTN